MTGNCGECIKLIQEGCMNTDAAKSANFNGFK